jgi:PilZ domain
MTFANDLGRDLVEQQAFDLWRQEQTATIECSSLNAQLRLLVMLQREILQVVRATTIVVSVVNAHAKGWLRIADSFVVTTFEPAYSDAFKRGIEMLSPHSVYFNLIGCWQELDARLVFACRASRIIQQPCAIALIDADAVADAWRRVAHSTIKLYDAVSAQIPAAQRTIFQEADGPAAIAALACASNGDAPCIDKDGLLSVPGWAERRSRHRMTVTVSGKIRVGVVVYPATVFNVSPNGIGLSVPTHLAPGTSVEITLPHRRALKGEIRWSRDDRVGVALQTPLDPTDPLLSHAEHR